MPKTVKLGNVLTYLGCLFLIKSNDSLIPGILRSHDKLMVLYLH